MKFVPKHDPEDLDERVHVRGRLHSEGRGKSDVVLMSFDDGAW